MQEFVQLSRNQASFGKPVLFTKNTRGYQLPPKYKEKPHIWGYNFGNNPACRDENNRNLRQVMKKNIGFS
jgi:hypothetical protein